MTNPESPRPAPEPLHALLVEDSADDAELVVHQLHQSGFDLTFDRVETEADYLARLEKSPAIILADYALPGFSGLRALELLQRGDWPFPLSWSPVPSARKRPRP